MKFTERHAHETVALLELFKKGVKWSCENRYQVDFEKLKTLFCEEVVLTFPDIFKPYLLQIDAGDFALGAMLKQKNLDEKANNNPKFQIITEILCIRSGNSWKMMIPTQLVKDFNKEYPELYGHVFPIICFKILNEDFYSPKC